MADAGLFEQLLGGADERAVADAQQQQNMYKPGSAAARAFGHGQNAAPLVGGVGAGIAGLFNEEGRSKAAFGRNFSSAARKIEESRIAQANGMSVDTYRSNQRIKRAVSTQNFGDQSKIENQIKAAQFIAQEANKDGNSAAFAKAMDALNKLRSQQKEFRKLEAVEARDNEKHELNKTQTVWLKGSSTPVDAIVEQDENGVLVAKYGANGREQRAYGFSGVDPAKRKDGTPRANIVREFAALTKPEEVAKTREMVLSGSAMLRAQDHIITNLKEWAKEGRAEEIMSSSGSIVNYVDNAARNLRSVSSSLLKFGASGENTKKQKEWMAKATDMNDTIWSSVELPEYIKQNAAASEQFRAQIMELAYIAARMAEPSNRGLSDNDIENALNRIVGNTSNPQTMISRFAEMVAEGTSKITDAVELYSNIIPESEEYDAEEIKAVTRKMLGGDAIDSYYKRYEKFNAKHGITFTEDGRALFAEPIDATIRPSPESNILDNPEVSDDEFMDSILGVSP